MAKNKRMFALFKDGKQISKAHSTPWAAKMEAMERKIVFGNKRKGFFLLKGYEVLEVQK